jgi:murein DD-endopeptidase MepM/ murein hydrolase activator NlpD
MRRSVVGDFPGGRVPRARLTWCTLALSTLLVAALVSPAPGTAVVASDLVTADDGDRMDRLRDRREDLSDRIGAQRHDIEEVSADLVAAQGRVDAAVEDLADARLELRDARDALAAAELRDREMQEKLDRAILRLEDAREDLRLGIEAVDDKRAALAGYAVSKYQAPDAQVLDLGLSLTADSAGEALDDLQIGATVLDKQSVLLQELEAEQVLLELTEQRVEDAKDDVAVKRQEAADHLAETELLRDEARTARVNVADKLRGLRAERQSIADLKRAELRRLARLERDRQRIQDELIAIALRRARQREAALLKTSPPGSTGFIGSPVASGYITSPYGMRLHPILHVWKLHDGTDFGAACGAPVFASADGRVSSAYYNGGYGNRIIIDHGFVRGVSLWTSVNHLSAFAVRAGERVSKGDVIGYVGSTGYSTGCHMHFMVYVNGYTVDPMGWL